MTLKSLFIYVVNSNFANFYSNIGLNIILIGLSVFRPAVYQFSRRQKCWKGQSEEKLD